MVCLQLTRESCFSAAWQSDHQMKCCCHEIRPQLHLGYREKSSGFQSIARARSTTASGA